MHFESEGPQKTLFHGADRVVDGWPLPTKEVVTILAIR
jgi:hypothetical protein